MKTKQKKCNSIKIIANTVTIVMTILIILFAIYGIKSGIFKSPDILTSYMKQFGIIAPIIFILIQIIQVVFPIIPGGASCLVGVLAFGPIAGFIYNYIGLCIGSVLAFFLSRNYGRLLVKKMFSEETIEKYIGPEKTKTFHKIFFWGVFLPGAPDDLLCYLAGLTPIKFSHFLFIILVGKPFTLVLYSLGIDLFSAFFH